MAPETTSRDVTGFCRQEALGLEIWIDGGPGEPWIELSRDDSRLWNSVMGDGKDKGVDLYVIVIDEESDGLSGPPERGEGMYPQMPSE